MYKILKQLDIIADVAKRLKDLSVARGTPKNVSEDLQERSETLSWALTELRKQFVCDALLIIGNNEVLLDISSLSVEHIHLCEDDHSVGRAIVFNPDAIANETIIECFENEETNLSFELPEWLKCRRYFTIDNHGDITGKAILFECVILKQWLEDIGYKTAKKEIAKWLDDIFRNIK